MFEIENTFSLHKLGAGHKFRFCLKQSNSRKPKPSNTDTSRKQIQDLIVGSALQ